MNEKTTLVYTTGVGRVSQEKKPEERPPIDGIVRISLKRLGGNKCVTTITGIPGSGSELLDLCKTLKQKCGTGGAVKNWIIELQGDKRTTVFTELERRGLRVKHSGG